MFGLLVTSRFHHDSHNIHVWHTEEKLYACMPNAALSFAPAAVSKSRSIININVFHYILHIPAQWSIIQKLEINIPEIAINQFINHT